MAKRKSRHNVAYLLILPSYSIFFLFVFIPVVLSIIISFTNYDFYKTFDFVGFYNFGRMFKDSTFLTAIKNTFVYSVFVIFFQIVLGLIIADVLNRKVIGQKFHRIAVYLPNITSMVAISMVWLWIYDPNLGILNKVLVAFGISPQRWLFDTDLALPSIMIMSIWKFIGYNMIIYLAGLQNIPKSLYEAAVVDGASGIQQFFKITVPMLRPVTFFLFVIASIKSFNGFEQVNVLTDGGPMNATTTIVHQIYERAFRDFQMGYASSMAVFLLVVTLIFTLLNFRFGNQGTDTGIN